MTLNALTVDLEEYFHVSNFEGVIDRARWDLLPSRVTDSARRLLDLFDATGNRATFFVLGWVAERHPRLVRELAERGHELACHGYGHQLAYEIGPEGFRADVRRGRAAVEDAAGIPVRGYRAPSYSITRRSLWALEILHDEGFRFDSSIFPIRHPRYGIPDFPLRPVRIELAGGASIQEFPPTTLAAGPLRLPVAGGAYLRFLPGPLVRWGWRRLAAADEPAVLYVHPWEIDPDQPRQKTGWRVRVNHYYNLGRTEGRLRQLLERIRFASMGEVLRRLESLDRLPSYRFPEGIPRPGAEFQSEPARESYHGSVAGDGSSLSGSSSALG